MQKRGYSYAVLAQKDSQADLEKEVYRGIPIWRFDFSSRLAQKDLSLFRSLRDCLEQIAPDLIHLNVCTGWSAFAFLLLKSTFRVPIALTVHAPFFYEGPADPLTSHIVSAAHAVGCVSDWVLQELEKLLPLAKDKLRRIHNGLLCPSLTPSPLPLTPPIFLLLGRLTSEKGFATAVEAFILLKKKGSLARLWIAGAGEERLSLEQLVNAAGLQGEVRWLGEVKRDEVPQLISQATCVLVPSYFETFGLVILEAMQMERPVIASRVGGIPEVLLAPETGLLVPPRDPAALAEAMEQLLAQPERMVQMGIAGRERATQHFTIQKNGTEYETLYKQVKQR